MGEQRRRALATQLLVCAIAVGCGSLLLRAAVLEAPQAPDLFDQIYARGRPLQASLRTVTAAFTETTTSSLLSRPLVARGTLAGERPPRIVLRYSTPERRILLIHQTKMRPCWPWGGVCPPTD